MANAIAEPVWQNALPPKPELFARLRVASLLHDERLRTLVEPLQRAALPRGEARIVLSPVIDRADQFVVAARGETTVIVLVGVRADTWPDAILAPGGAAAFHEVAHTDRIVEHQTEDGTMSLFVLPGRTWVIASGKDRARVRRELLTAHPEPPAEETSLAELRLRGDDLVRQIPQLGAGNLADVGHRLDSMHLVIEKGLADRMLVRLTYMASEDRVRSEEVLARIKDVATRSGKLPWFASAGIASEGRTVTLTWDLAATKGPIPGTAATAVTAPP